MEDRVSGDDRPNRVKVVDRRRFTADGEVRDLPDEPAASAARAPEPVPAGAPIPPEADVPAVPTAAPAGEVPWPDSSVAFADLVDLLATQAYSNLTGQGTGRGPDPRSARVFIDFLGVLQDKTKGRLSAQEERLLDDVLYQLRTLFLAPPR
jgi:hypothetical protein